MAQQPLPRNVWTLGFVSLLMDLSSEIYHALLPAFVTVFLGLPATALGAIDGIAEGSANIAKLASGRLSDRHQRRKPLIVIGYGLAALTKPLFALAANAPTLMAARFLDRVGKGIRGAPRDALIADETAAGDRGRAYGLRQSLDTVGALIAPLAAIALMALFAGDMRAVFWVAAIPALLSAALAWTALTEPRRHRDPAGPTPLLGGWRELGPGVRRLLALGFLVSLARFSEGFLILKGMEAGLSAAWSPLVLVLFNLAFFALAYPAGSLSDRVPPTRLLLAGLAILIAGNLLLAESTGLAGMALGTLLWGAHMALTQGIFARLIADAAPAAQRGTAFGAYWFVTGIGTLLASLGAGLLWDREGSAMVFAASAGVAGLSAAMLWLMPRPAPAAQ
jgi:MFS family permease